MLNHQKNVNYFPVLWLRMLRKDGQVLYCISEGNGRNSCQDTTITVHSVYPYSGILAQECFLKLLKIVEASLCTQQLFLSAVHFQHSFYVFKFQCLYNPENSAEGTVHMLA